MTASIYNDIICKVKILDRGQSVLERKDYGILYDYYGALLTDKQRDLYDLYYNEDLSLAEIAELKGISRQAAWDNIKHAEEKLIEIEEKTGLIKKVQELEWRLKTYQTN